MPTVRFLQVEPTTRCNFTCSFCSGRYMEQEDLPLPRFLEMIDALPDVEHLELQGEGESLMHPSFLDMVRAARARGIKVSLISNGSYLSLGLVERLLDLEIEKISISMESADSATFRQIRGGKLEKVVRGIELLMEERRQRRLSKPVVGLSITVLRDTQDHLLGILDLYRRLGLDGGVTLQPLSTMPPYIQNYPQGLQQQVLSDAEVNGLWVQFYSNARVRAITRAKERTGIRGFYDELMAGFRPMRKSCPWLEAGLYVNRRGEASACCMVKDTERFGFGRIGETPLPQILQRREHMRETLARGEEPAACAGCELSRFARMTRLGLVAFALRGLWMRLVPERVLRRLRPARPRRSLPLLPSA